MNFHPPLSTFPIVLFTISTLFEILGRLKHNKILINTARVNAVSATIFMFAAFFSGYQAAETASQTFKVSAQIIADHQSIGRILLFVSIPTAFLAVISNTAKHNQKAFCIFYYLFLIISLILAIYCGWLGGQLVFTHGAGVRASI